MMLFVDGSVHFVAEDAAPELLDAMATAAGGEIVGAD